MGTTGADEAEPPSLDMLKNTPSNIRRLTNEIEQCVGRQKYLAQTRSPSDGGDFRWYFCRIPLGINELAASIPRTEIVGKGDYFRFGMRDSLAIEASFLQREEELLSSWWREYAECSEGPRGHHSTISKSSQKHSSESPESCQLFTTEEERVGVPVKGGLYEVDLVRRHSFPVYWNGENRRVLRGHWFARKGGLDWLPLREDVSEQLEYAYRAQVWHRRTFQPSGLFAARVDLQGSTSGLHALFTGEDDTWEAWLGVDTSGISSIVSLGNNGIKLRRGYAPSQSKKPTQDELRQRKEEDMDDYCSQVPVRHLVFMVHGIGQRLEKSNLVDDVGCLRHVTASLAERHLTSHQLGTQRVLYIPCQWRKGLTLGGEAAVEKITLDGVRGLRTMLSGTVHDVLYYMSPIHCQDIIDSVSLQLNKLYLKFLKRNPGYDGKVSIYGHSLGSVLSYDILCHQENLYSPFPMEWMYKKQKENVPHCSTRNNESSNCNPTLGVQDESSENSGGESIVSHTDNPNVEEHVEGVCNQLGPPASSDSDESMYVDTGHEQPNDALISVENSTETPGISDNRENCENEMTDSNSMKSEIIPCDENPSGKDVADCTSIDAGYEQIIDALESVEKSTENPSISDNREYCESEMNSSNSMKSEIIPCDENPSVKDVDDCTSIDTGYEQISDALESVENSTETPSISDKREYYENEMNRANILKSEIIPCDANPSVKDVVDNDKDEIIKSLIEEIDLLKSKIKEFEVACTDRVSTTPVNGTEPRSVLEHTDSSKCYTPQIRYTKLEFKVDTFFAVGSPLGVFLSLRNVRIGIGRGQDYWEEKNINEEMPACRQMFNVFHPFDPVAYRIEPLVCKEYLDRRPVIVPYHRGGKRLYVGYQEFKEGIAARSQAFKDQLSTVRVKVLTICESRSNDDDAEESENTQEKEERTYGSIMMETLTGSVDGRIDHVLQDKTFRHPYISAIGAHTNYWRDPDTALFILKHLYRDIPEHSESSMKDDHKNKWFDPRVIDDEQLPLTFASGVSVKHFVYTAKKVMKGADDTHSL